MIPNAIRIAVCTSSFVYMAYVLYNLIIFLSSHNEDQKSMVHTSGEETLVVSTITTLLSNTCLLSVFMLQHSIMASNFVKQVYSRIDMQDLERSVYNVSSAAALHLLLNNWNPVPWVTVWNIDTAYSNKLWLTFTGLHTLGWFVVYSGCLMMDISELIGLKQVYYKISSRPPPMVMKSRELQRYYAHMRHPSFTGFLIILWAHPFMSIDRILLAALLTSYMILMWTIDQKDCNYHASTIQMKNRAL